MSTRPEKPENPKTHGNPGKLVIISGPSGSGKSTVVARLLKSCPLPLELSVSATTRAPRPEEIDGTHYHFLSREQFEEKRANGEFLESCEVYPGIWYGTPVDQVDRAIGEGQYVILEIDVRGAMKVLDQRPEAITIFIDAGGIEELERRLRGRRTETEDKILKRLAVAKEELSYAHRYQHTVPNTSVDAAAQTICQRLSGDRPRVC